MFLSDIPPNRKVAEVSAGCGTHLISQSRFVFSLDEQRHDSQLSQRLAILLSPRPTSQRKKLGERIQRAIRAQKSQCNSPSLHGSRLTNLPMFILLEFHSCGDDSLGQLG